MSPKSTLTPRPRSRPVRLLPSILTILALCAGLSAVKFAIDGDLGFALAAVVAAGVLDTLDGRLARMLNATSKMGGELDSLADAISFGVSPALVLYVSLLEGSRGGWVIALVYVVAIVLRLARFNTLVADANRPPYTRDYFVGVPAPAGAIIALLPIALLEQFGDGWWAGYYPVAAWTVFSAALIVSTIPTLAMKSASVPRAGRGGAARARHARRGTVGDVPVRPDDHPGRGVLGAHPVRHPVAALGGGTARDVGAQTVGATSPAPRHPAGAERAPLRGPARVAQARRSVAWPAWPTSRSPHG